MKNNTKVCKKLVPHSDILIFFKMLNESLESDKELDPEKEK
jgi:hypothetical protein